MSVTSHPDPNPSPSPEAEAALQSVLDDPLGSVERASKPDHRNSLLVNALVVGVGEAKLWPAFRDAGVVRLFISFIVDGWKKQDDEVFVIAYFFSCIGI